MKQDYTFETACVFAGLYWLHCGNKKGSIPIIACKGLSTFLLAAYSANTNPENRTLNIALAGHFVGDVLIETTYFKHPFLMAIPAFFLGHLYYCAHLFKNSTSPLELQLPKLAGLALFTIGSTMITKAIVSKTDGILSKMIPAYAGALGMMFILATLQKENAGLLALAAACYIISDVAIAANKFILKIENPDINRWWNRFTFGLYFGAQAAATSVALTMAENTKTRHAHP